MDDSGKTFSRCVGGVLVDGGKILLAHRRKDRASFPNVWDIPGGHVEQGESDWDALRRELREELGIEIGNRREEPFQSFADDSVRLSVWVLGTWEGSAINLANDEHDEIRWVGEDELEQLELADPAYFGLFQAVFGRSGR